jgi:hypothetical protein
LIFPVEKARFDGLFLLYGMPTGFRLRRSDTRPPTDADYFSPTVGTSDTEWALAFKGRARRGRTCARLRIVARP